jgi:hypothetical protein
MESRIRRKVYVRFGEGCDPFSRNLERSKGMGAKGSVRTFEKLDWRVGADRRPTPTLRGHERRLRPQAVVCPPTAWGSPGVKGRTKQSPTVDACKPGREGEEHERAPDPSSEPTSQSGLAGLVYKDTVPGPRALSSVVCTPLGPRRTARPYGDSPTPIRNRVTADRLPRDDLSSRAGGQP